MAKIAVDIDSTLYDFETPAREAFTKLAEERDDPSILNGAYHPWTEWRSPADVCGLEVWLDAIALCHDADVIEAQVPFNGAVETCQALVNEGHELLYISNRATEAAQPTTNWLHEWGFLVEHSKVICLMGDKKPHLADCQYLIDDRPKTVVDFIYDADWQFQYGPMHDENTELKRRAFVLAYPYNQALTDIPHLYLAPTWAGINTYLVGKGVLSAPAYHALGAVAA